MKIIRDFIRKVRGNSKIDPNKVEVPCSLCGVVLLRKIWIPNATCFDCKVKRRNLYARGRYTPRTYAVDVDRDSFNRERELVMTEMRLEGKTLAEIGESLTPKITRERVRQILAHITFREGIVFDKQYKHGMVADRVTIKCRQEGCTEMLTLLKSQCRGEGRHACDAHKRKKYLTAEGKVMTAAERIRHRYHNDPEWRKKRLAQSKAWHYKELAKKGEYYKKYYKYQAAYHRKQSAASRLHSP